MNANSIPEIVKSESSFSACVLEVTNYVLTQPTYIQEPIAQYGACVEAHVPPGREILVEFMRAMHRAQVQIWTKQVSDPLYADTLNRLEDTIALRVHLARRAQQVSA